jgi:hypothetical protein
MPASAMLMAMSREPEAEPELEPPWAAYPWIQYGSIGWRMGCGEDYLMQWYPYAARCIVDFPSALAYLQRHPRAPRPWASFLLSWLPPLARANPRGALQLDRAQVDALGLVGDDVAYPVFVRNAQREGGMTAPWTWRVATDSPAAGWRYLTREIGWWARWLATGCADRTAWLDAQPAPSGAWSPVVAAVRARRADPAWATLTGGAEQLIPLAVAHGALPPPWLGGHPPRDAIVYDVDPADDIDRWAWWLFATLDDPASWRGYLARWPPPPAWQATLAREPYRELDRAIR